MSAVFRYSLAVLTSSVVLAGAVSQAATLTVFSDNFTYTDGNLTSAAGTPWSQVDSGGELTVAGGKAVINNDLPNGQDVAATLAGAPFSSGTLTATFDLTMTELPTGAGFFAGFRDTVLIKRGLYTTLVGAAPNTY